MGERNAGAGSVYTVSHAAAVPDESERAEHESAGRGRGAAAMDRGGRERRHDFERGNAEFQGHKLPRVERDASYLTKSARKLQSVSRRKEPPAGLLDRCRRAVWHVFRVGSFAFDYAAGLECFKVGFPGNAMN